MKYAKRIQAPKCHIQHRYTAALGRCLFGFTLLLSLVGLGGCGTTTAKQDLAAEEDALQQIDTRAYLPVEKFDKEGIKLPYEPSLNPYAEQKGRIKKESVSRYIDARRALKAENYDLAAEKLRAIVADDASLSGPWVMLGDIALKQDNIKQAQEHFEKAIAVNPENVNAYLRLAKVLRIKGEFLKAQNVYAETLALWPDFPEAHLNLAVLYDVYMDQVLMAQMHMEAYQFLTDNENETVAAWLENIRQRTGVAYSIKAGKDDPEVSFAGGVEQ